MDERMPFLLSHRLDKILPKLKELEDTLAHYLDIHDSKLLKHVRINLEKARVTTSITIEFIKSAQSIDHSYFDEF